MCKHLYFCEWRRKCLGKTPATAHHGSSMIKLWSSQCAFGRTSNIQKTRPPWQCPMQNQVAKHAKRFAFCIPETPTNWFSKSLISFRASSVKMPAPNQINQRPGWPRFFAIRFSPCPLPDLHESWADHLFLDRRLRRKCPGSTSERSVPISCGVFHRLGIGCVSKALSIQRWLLDKKCSMPTCLKPS